jgi:hypothetical protein
MVDLYCVSTIPGRVIEIRYSYIACNVRRLNWAILDHEVRTICGSKWLNAII